ncbi:MAG: UvrB/UvrC motif-containing protein [Clostridia bacterium]|nr:UvrB/UvrC motif-containing protein [Clostridia bacterium]MDD4376357.1 UvrB/UvrC motif-containing protein [Clostridia bacterium]
MKCSKCKINEAKIKYEENVNGIKKSMDLCEECSRNLGILSSNIGFMDNLLMSLMDEPITIGTSKTLENTCKNCGYHFSDYTSTGLFGCPECYTTFEKRLLPMFHKIHGTASHLKDKNDKTVKNGKEIKKENTILELKGKLMKHIQNEEYEEAAKLRDLIKEKERKGEI